MARLTWQNVDAPDLTKAADILNAAANQVGVGGGGIASAVRNARKDQMDRRSAAALPILAGIQSGGDVQGALDQIGSILRPEDMNEETRAAYLGLMGKGLGFDQTRVGMDATRAATDSVRGAEGRAQTNAERGWKVEDQEAAVAGKIQERIDGGRYGPQGGTGANGLPDNERDLLALTLQAEAGGEGYQGMLAAGAVVNNRVQSGKYGVGFGGVITRPGQFSYLNGVTGYAGGQGAIDPSNIRISDDAYAAADAIMSGNYKDPTGGATHYYNDKVADPAWGANKAGGDWVRIGNHVFGSPDGKAGTGSNTRPAGGVSDLIGPDNVLPTSFWQNQGDKVWGAEEEGYQRGRSRADDARTDEEARIAREALERATTRMTEGGLLTVEENNRAIAQDDSLTNAEKRAEMAATRELFGANPELSSTVGLPTPDLTKEGYDPRATELQIGQMEANQKFNNTTDPTLRGLDIGGISGEASTASVLEGIGNIRKSAEDSGITFSNSDGEISNVVNSVAKDYGVDPRIVLAAMGNATKSDWTWTDWNGAVQFDEETLRSAMETYGSRDDYQKAVTKKTTQEKRISDAQKIASRQEALVSQITLLEGRGLSTDKQLEELKKLNGDFAAIMEADKAANPSESQIAADEAKAIEAKKVADAWAAGGRAGQNFVDRVGDKIKYGNLEDAFTLNTTRRETTERAKGTAPAALVPSLRESEMVDMAAYIAGGGQGIPADQVVQDYASAPLQQRVDLILKEAAAWSQTPEALALFQANPQALASFQDDPVAFMIQLQQTR